MIPIPISTPMLMPAAAAVAPAAAAAAAPSVGGVDGVDGAEEDASLEDVHVDVQPGQGPAWASAAAGTLCGGAPLVSVRLLTSLTLRCLHHDWMVPDLGAHVAQLHHLRCVRTFETLLHILFKPALRLDGA